MTIPDEVARVVANATKRFDTWERDPLDEHRDQLRAVWAERLTDPPTTEEWAATVADALWLGSVIDDQWRLLDNARRYAAVNGQWTQAKATIVDLLAAEPSDCQAAFEAAQSNAYDVARELREMLDLVGVDTVIAGRLRRCAVLLEGGDGRGDTTGE